MRRFFLLCALSLPMAQAGACAHQSLQASSAGSEQQPTVASVRELIGKGKLEEAQRDLDTLAALHPEPQGIERLRGFISYQQSRMADADASFSKALEQDPADLESMQMRGVVLYRMGRPAEAIPLLEKAHTTVASVNVDPDYVLASCYVVAGRYNDARHAFADQYGFAPDSAPAYLITARMLLRHQLLEVAEEAARKAVQLDARLPLAHQLLGEIALARGDASAAIAELQKERTLNPLNGSVYDRLGDAYIRSSQYPEARQALDRAILLEPNTTGPYILLGRVLLQQEQPVTATMYLERAAQMDPENSTTHMLLGQAYRTTGRKEEAMKEFQTAQQLRSGTPAAKP
jgi:predicted Zn-dependent protease